MRILVFHGYLLRGTGSNVYNARLVAALARRGATVDLLSQERRAHELDFVDAVGTWAGGEPRVEVLREPVRVTAWRPDIGDLLPVYVADRYEGVRAVPFLECEDEEIDPTSTPMWPRSARSPPAHGPTPPWPTTS
jgi:hypothetical protein